MATRYAGTPSEMLVLDTFTKLTRAVNALTARFHRSGVLGSLTESQFGVLEILFHLGPLSQGEICGKMLRSAGNLTVVVDNLEKQNLVQRTPAPHDRRSTIVSLTPAGESLIAEIFPRVLHHLMDEFSVLAPEEQALLGQLCKRLGLQIAKQCRISANSFTGTEKEPEP